ncbi:hypothetical protein BVG19_g1226 [[Candida] boidinii]|nr:hypothetical protein BVG19_g1226 [[Candida] boidinii]OWB52631.1 hypothetical protein B5S27_g4208 [[Candida] boidinii]
MIPTWVMDKPTGAEIGKFLSIDFGGTNLRVVFVDLKGNSKFEFDFIKFKIPQSVKTAKNNKELFLFICDAIQYFFKIKSINLLLLEPGEKMPMGFTFSFPVTQNAINQGELQKWTKGFDIRGIENSDIVAMLQGTLNEYDLPVNVVSVINDTTGTLIASMYSDPNTIMGLVFGTGVNGAYFEKIENIEKLKGILPTDIIEDGYMAINCEFGAFDNAVAFLPVTEYDIQINRNSENPNQQCYEKLISGYYLGEIVRLILVDCHAKGLIFKDQDTAKLMIKNILDASFLSEVEKDSYYDLESTYDIVIKTLHIASVFEERNLIQKICLLVGSRAARLSACAIAGVMLQSGNKSGNCAIDGSVFNKYTGFKEKVEEALKEIFNWRGDSKKRPISLKSAEDGSGAGAAIIACLTKERLDKGKSVGRLNKSI